MEMENLKQYLMANVFVKEEKLIMSFEELEKRIEFLRLLKEAALKKDVTIKEKQ